MGRTNVSADSIPLMSDIGETSSNAAARGSTFLPALVARDEYVRVLARECRDQSREILGELVGVGRAVRDAHLPDAGDLRRGIGHSGASGAGNQHVDVVVEPARGGDRVEGGRGECGVVVFRDDEDAHLDHLGFVLQLLDQLGHAPDPHSRIPLRRLR